MTIVNITNAGTTVWGASTEPFWCEVGAVGKTNDVHPFVVANELIASRLGAMAGVPCAHGAILQSEAAGPDGLAYISFVAYPGGIDPPAPPTSGVVAAKPGMCAAAVALDCWLMNADRHRDNVVYAPDLQVPFTLIDFEGALLADGRDVTEAPYREGHHLLGSQLHSWVTSIDDLAKWADMIGMVPDLVIERTCKEAAAMGAITQVYVDQLVAVLQYRKRHLKRFLQNAIDEGFLSRINSGRMLV